MLRRNTETRGYETMNPERRREIANYATQQQDGYDRGYQDDYDRRYQDDYEEERDDYDEDDRPVSSYRSRYEENDWDEKDRPSSTYRGREEDWYDGSRPSSNYRQQQQGWDEDEDYDNVSNEFVDDEDFDDGNYNERYHRRGAFYSTPEKGRRGFASMSRDEVSRIGRKGGLASHRNDRTNRDDDRSRDTRERRQEGSNSRSSSSSTKKTSSGSSRRGFAAMSPEKVSRIARKGGLASHKNQQSKSSNGRNASTKRAGTSRNR